METFGQMDLGVLPDRAVAADLVRIDVYYELTKADILAFCEYNNCMHQIGWLDYKNFYIF